MCSRSLLTSWFCLSAMAVLCSGCLRLNGLSGYQEFTHEGRIYVLSRPATIENFMRTGEVQIGKTMIGKGPQRETVVIEADAKDAWLQDTLWKLFRQRHDLN